MSDEQLNSIGERVRALARLLSDGDVVRVRIQRANEEIEVARRRFVDTNASRSARSTVEAAPQRIDTIKADLVGIFHTMRPAPVAGDDFESDRELGYIEALGIRTPVHSMGGGRLVSVAVADGVAVEYGQPLFLVARGH